MQEEHFGEMGRGRMEEHHKYVREVTPAEKFFMVELRDGWGPLCEALGMEVPDEEFPRMNDAEAVKRLEGQIVVEAAKYWGAIVAVAGVGVYALMEALR